MAILSTRTRTRFGEIGVTFVIILAVWLLQLVVMPKFRGAQIFCNLPLTLTIVWGLTFGSPMRKPTDDELRVSSFSTILARQLLSGSPSGAIVGAAFAALSTSVDPLYPISYPVIGWTAGYFSLRNFNQAAFLCIPLVVILTFMGEMIMAAQIFLSGRTDILSQFLVISFPESMINALIAPVLFFPMRGWYEYASRQMMVR